MLCSEWVKPGVIHTAVDEELAVATKGVDRPFC
jgi:hypothetical protein